MEFQPEDVTRVWRALVQTEQLSDGAWRAWYPGAGWSVTAPTEDGAEQKVIEEAIRRGEDPDTIARHAAAARRGPIQLEPDDPRRKGVWRFTPQTKQFSDGTWRAWYPSGGWSVIGGTEDEAKDKAFAESIRRPEDPDEIARKVATMRRHLVEPVPGCGDVRQVCARTCLGERQPRPRGAPDPRQSRKDG
jgi:hypothetical protein